MRQNSPYTNYYFTNNNPKIVTKFALINPRQCWALIFFVLFGCQDSSSIPVEQWKHATEGSYGAAISRDGSLSVVSSIHHGLALWDLNENGLKYLWTQHQGNSDNIVFIAKIADDNSTAMTASREEFSLWDIDTGESIGYWKIKDSSIRDIALSNKGRHIVLGKTSGVVVHIDRNTGRRLEFVGHSDRINSVDMYPNGRIVMSGSSDFKAYVWDSESGQVIYQFNHPTRVTKVAIDPLGRYAFSADSMKLARIWDLKTGEMISQLQYYNRQEVFSSVRFSDDGRFLATGAPSRKLSLWDVKTGERLESWRVTTRKDVRPAGAVVHDLAFRDNGTLITESSAGYAEIWQIPQHLSN